MRPLPSQTFFGPAQGDSDARLGCLRGQTSALSHPDTSGEDSADAAEAWCGEAESQLITVYASSDRHDSKYRGRRRIPRLSGALSAQDTVVYARQPLFLSSFDDWLGGSQNLSISELRQTRIANKLWRCMLFAGIYLRPLFLPLGGLSCGLLGDS